MKHLGDITKISGHNVPITDCVIFGAPCQDLSVAGKRAGMKHSDLGDEETTRSGLFMEAVRIIKEMRETDVRSGRSGVDVRCRYGIYENVPGAFSSNGGDDFRVVLEELARIVEEGVTIPRPAKGKWSTTGVIIGDKWSLAWRVFDAQYWGVPQRRRRICIVVDFNGHTAPQIVFSEGEHHGSTERGNTKPSVGYLGEESRPEIQSFCEGLSRHLESCQPQGEEVTTDASGGFGAGNREREREFGIDPYNGAITGDKASTLGVNCGMATGRQGVCTFEPGIASREGGHVYEGVSGTLRAKAGDNQMAVAYTMQDREGKAGGGKGALIAEEKSATLRANNMQYLFQPITIDMGGGKSSVDIHTDRSPTLTTTHYGEPAVVYDASGNGDGTVAPTMTGDHQNRVTDYTGVVVSSHGFDPSADRDVGALFLDECSKTITNGTSPGHHTGVIVALDRASFNQGKNAKFDFEVSEDGINSPIVAKGPSAVAYAVDARNCTKNETNGSLQSNSAHSLNGNNVARVKYIVRRLTPLERERLQGFPDRWTDIGEYIDSKGKKKQSSDAARYKALGNSIALPPWKWVLKRLCACYERDATMGSLFSGIGGFDLLWTQLNGPNSVRFSSEIDEFPIAVSKKHFGDETTGEKGDYYEAILGRN